MIYQNFGLRSPPKGSERPIFARKVSNFSRKSEIYEPKICIFTEKEVPLRRNYNLDMRKSTTASQVEAPVAEGSAVKKATRSRKKAVAPQTEENAVKDAEGVVAAPAEDVKNVPEAPAEETSATQPETKKPVKNTVIPPLPKGLVVRDFVDLMNVRIPLLNDQQIQMLTLQEAQERHLFFEAILAQVLDFDVVISDTNIWLELLVGHTSSHSDPRVNARLMFERQLEFISKMMKKRGGRFMIMSETYEEIDRFASAQEPTNYQNADWEDPALCRNVSARLAKRLIMSQQRENRLRIEGVTSESHHASFADPAIIRRVVELFAQGKKVLVITNDASVAIRSMGICDDLQRINNIDDATWDRQYAPLRPLAITMDDLKVIDNYTRQYHFLQVAAGAGWMQDMAPQTPHEPLPVLQIDENTFRPGDKRERRSDKEDRLRNEQIKEQQRQAKEQLEQQQKQLKQDQQKLEQQQKQLKQDLQNLDQQRQQIDQQRQQLRQDKQQFKQDQQKLEQQQKQNQESFQSSPSSQSSPSYPSTQSTPAEETTLVAPAAPAEETAAPVLPTFSPEDMELIATPAAKKRTHRGGRRRGGSGNSAKGQAQ